MRFLSKIYYKSKKSKKGEHFIMPSYRQRFFALLLPISIVSTLISLFYFQKVYGYGLAQTIPIASIFGFLIGGGISFISAFIFLLPPKAKSQGIDLSHRKKSKENKKSTESKQNTETSVEKEVPAKTEVPVESVEKIIKGEVKEKREITKEVIKEKIPIIYKMILLMDKGLAFEVTYEAIKKQNMTKLSADKNTPNLISIQMPSEMIKIHIDNLTRHTSKVTLQSIEYQVELKQIISYLKTKEYAFLQY